MEQTFIDVHEVEVALGVSTSKAYQVIRKLNNELIEKGFMVVTGKVSRKYFNERFYGFCSETIVKED